jgi:hypothetical protein
MSNLEVIYRIQEVICKYGSTLYKGCKHLWISPSTGYPVTKTPRMWREQLNNQYLTAYLFNLYHNLKLKRGLDFAPATFYDSILE